MSNVTATFAASLSSIAESSLSVSGAIFSGQSTRASTNFSYFIALNVLLSVSSSTSAAVSARSLSVSSAFTSSSASIFGCCSISANMSSWASLASVRLLSAAPLLLASKLDLVLACFSATVTAWSSTCYFALYIMWFLLTVLTFMFC